MSTVIGGARLTCCAANEKSARSSSSRAARGPPRSSLAMAAMETTIAKDCAILGYRDVLVSQDESDASVHALVYADMLCSAFGGHLTGLMFGLVPFYPMSAANARVPEAWIHAQRQASEEAEQSERRIKAIYGKLAARNEL